MKTKRWILRAELWTRDDAVTLVEAVVPRFGPRESHARYFCSDPLVTPMGLPLRIEFADGTKRDGLFVWSGETRLLEVYPVSDLTSVRLLLQSNERLAIGVHTPVGG